MTPAERLRKHQRALEKTQRELDRERTKLENQEKKLVQEIKKNAKNGQMGAVKVQAKDLVRTRRYIQKFYQMRTQLQAISLRIQTVRSNEQMMQSMKGATSTCSAETCKRKPRGRLTHGSAPGQHESADEPPRAATHRHGV